jgi:GT2 family glycosyltransferase
MLEPDARRGKVNTEEELARALRESEMLAAENERLLLELRGTSERYAAIRGSLSWRVTAPLRLALDWALAARRLLGWRGAVATGPRAFNEENYRRWVAQFDRLNEADRRAIRAAIGRLTRRPLFSLLLVVRDPPAEALRDTMRSIRRQLYPDWEICLVDDASTAPHVARALASCGDDPRVRIATRDRRGGLAAAGNDALSMAHGEYVAFLDMGDVVAESALFEIAAEIDAHPGAAVVYTDEDSLDARGERNHPRFKTAWNPDLLLAQDYLGRLTVYERKLVAGIGGLRDEFAGACHYALALRATGATAAGNIRHVAAVLCHRHTAQAEDDAEASRRTVQDRVGDQGLVEAAPGGVRGHRVRWRNTEPPVSVIIATRDRADLLERCVEGLLHRTKYPALEVIVVDNGSREERTLELFAKYRDLENVRVLPYKGQFNWSAMNNAGAAEATGEILLFLNNDTDVTEQNWVRELVAQAVRPEVGAVGAKLLFPDGTVQHAGIWLGPSVFARHLLRLSGRSDEGYLGQLTLTRNLSAVTGACMAMRRDVFREAGGFDESFPVSYSDMDLCLRLVQRGYRIVWTPYAELLHLESASRGSSEWRWRKEEADLDRFCARWEQDISNDPFFNPNLDLIGEEKLALAFPPRRKRAWQS